MGDREGANKHYQTDFDPALLARVRKRQLDQLIKVRMLLPMSLQCLACGEFLYRGTTFNAQKETVKDELYLGQIRVFRFHMKCSRCQGEFTIKTDPERSDYVAERNVSRSLGLWRDQAEQVADANETRRREEEGDAMKQLLENLSIESKRQMELDAALAEIRSLNRHQAATDLPDAVIDERSNNAKQDEKDEED